MASTAGTNRPEMKASLLKEMGVLLDEYLDWYDGAEDIKFREIEEEILQLRKKMGAKLAEVVVEEERKAEGGATHCPECGGAMRNKGVKRKTLVSLVGEVKMNRVHYYCPQCRSGLFPPGRQNGGAIGME